MSFKFIPPPEAAAKKQRTADRIKLYDTVMGKAEKGELTFGEYRDLKAREGGLLDIDPEQFDKTFSGAGLYFDEAEGFAAADEGRDEYGVPMRLKKPEEQARRDALGGAKRSLARNPDSKIKQSAADTPTAGSDDRGEPTKGDRGKTTKGTRGGSVQGAVGGAGASTLPSTSSMAPYRGLGRNPNSRLKRG